MRRSAQCWSLSIAVLAAGCMDSASEIGPPTVNFAITASDPVIVAAGDLVCGSGTSASALCKHAETAALTTSIAPAAVLLLGDNQYESGTLSEYNTYYQPTWGVHKGITYPAPGNHEYSASSTAVGYFDYFNGIGVQSGRAGDRGKGYYSFNLGAWHIIALNSNCTMIGGCGAGSPQETWLRATLAANPTACTLAFWHHPLFSSGSHGNNASTQALWKALYDFDADVVLSGHDHDYERFAPQSPTGFPEPTRGIRAFVVGTGGREFRSMGTVKANSEVRNANSLGVLKLTLHPTSYDWQFVPIPGHTLNDAGTGSCVTQPSPPPPPPSVVAHVETITGVGTLTNPGRWNPNATINVRNANNAAVAGATVSGTWVETNWDASCLTDASGSCTLLGRADYIAAFPGMTFVVTNIIATNVGYDPAANKKSSQVVYAPGTTPPTPIVTNVQDLSGSGAVTYPGSWQASVTVIARNASGGVVNGAIVVGYWANGASGSSYCVTNASGVCMVSSPTATVAGSPSITFAVTGITGTNFSYNQAASLETSIVVQAPGGPPPPPPTTVAHIHDLSGNGTATVPGSWEASVTATVRDAGGAAVNGATVAGNWSNGATGSGSCVTNASGVCSLTSPSGTISGSPSMTFTVSNISGTNMTYDQSANVESNIVIQSPPPPPPPNQKPVPAVTLTTNGTTYTLDGSGSTDDQGVVSWTWRPTDPGRPVKTGAVITRTVMSHHPTYTEWLIVQDAAGLKDSIAQLIVPPGATPPPIVTHIHDLSGSGNATVPGSWQASVTATVRDAGGAAVSGATVAGNWSNGATGSGNCVTNASGVCSLTSPSATILGSPSMTFTVSNISGTNMTYNASANVESNIVVQSPPPPPPTQIVTHIHDLSGTGTATVPGSWQASVTATVRDAGGSAVSGATVAGNWSAGASGSGSCVTNGSGVCSLTSPSGTISGSPSMTFTVSNISGTNMTYDQSANVESNIVVQAPPPPPPPNQKPVAAVTLTTNGTTYTLDGRGSTDDQGVVSWTWRPTDLGRPVKTGSVITREVMSHHPTYTEWLIVQDAAGLVDSIAQIIVPPGGTPPPQVVTHIHDLSGSGSATVPGSWQASVTATVRDAGGAAVGGATVAGNWSNGTSGSGNCVTNASGVCSLTSPSATIAGSPSMTFTVSSISGTNMTYNASANVVSNVVVQAPSSSQTTLTLSPVADAYTFINSPTTNFGTGTTLLVDLSPEARTYFRFDVTGIGSRTIVSAKLRIYAVDASNAGGRLHRVSSTTWSETGITWNNQPAYDAATIGSLGSVTIGQWYEIDVQVAITGDGTYSFALESPSTNGADYTSREGTASQRPQLVIVIQ